MKLIKFLFFCLLSLSCNAIYAQQEIIDTELTQAIDKSTYEEVKNQLDFTKTKKALRPKRNKELELEEEEEEKKKYSRSPFSGFQGLGIFQLLSYVIIIGLVSFLIFMIFANIKIDKKFELSKENISLDEIEDIQDLDTDSLLDKALADGDYRAAVRIKFLAILKELSAQEKINWKREKTNRDYSRELRANSYGSNFNELTYIFDFVWYGKQQLTKPSYDEIDIRFNSFTKLLNE